MASPFASAVFAGGLGGVKGLDAAMGLPVALEEASCAAFVHPLAVRTTVAASQAARTLLGFRCAIVAAYYQVK